MEASGRREFPPRRDRVRGCRRLPRPHSEAFGGRVTSHGDPIFTSALVANSRRPARSLGDATSGAGPAAVACSPGGDQQRRTAGESEKRPHVYARVPHAPRGPRGHAETGQRGVSSWRSGIGAPAGRATAPYSLQGAGLRRLTLRVMRHELCRTYVIPNLTLLRKEYCVSLKK